MSGFSGIASTTLAVTAASAATPLPDASVPNLADPGEPPKLRGMLSARIIITPGTLAANDVVYIKFGDSAVVATAANGTPVIPGLVELHSLQPTETHIAAIASANTCTLIVTIGQEKSL